MTITRAILFVTTISASGYALAQADQPASPSSAVVNKCTAADGSIIFSDKPCADKQKAQKVDTSAALRTGSGGNNGEIAASVADSDCRGRARQSAYGADAAKIDESNRHIADYQQREKVLASQKAYASDGSGGLVDDPAAQQEIGRLDAAIAKEREFQQGLQKGSAAVYDAALKACDAQAKDAQSSPASK